MTRTHDKTQVEPNTRLKRYTDIERTERPAGTHPAARAVHERPATRSDTAKVKAYLRIERGQEA